jgi:ubiquinone/menaquinone biosynthesis C-methylase UbiE
MSSISSLLRCPESQTSLRKENADLVSEKGTHYQTIDGIPHLLTPTKSQKEEEVRQMMQEFYETVNFPGYDDVDSPAVLIEKAQRSGFGKWLDEGISPFATVLEVGCGTGQMTNFLGMVNTRTVIGVDQSIPSLKLGKKFRDDFELNNVHFVQGNIFSMPIAENSMDVLICSGVLHHTPDPKGGYEEILKLVKPGGIILIGLYNYYARVPTGIRKKIFSLTGRSMRFLDKHLRRKDVDEDKKEIWFRDQYQNPHESWHSVDEVLEWFAETGVEFVSAIPHIGGELPDENGTVQLFKNHPQGSKTSHILKQLYWMSTIGWEGGLFVLTGKKSE